MIIRKVALNSLEEELEAIGTDKGAFDIFRKKSKVLILKIYDLDSRGANMLKQEFLSAGGDVAVNHNVASWKISKTDCLLMGTERAYERVLEKISSEPYFGLKEAKEAVQRIFTGNQLPIFRIQGRTFDFNTDRFIMGILNVTPDSFSDGGNFTNTQSAFTHAKEMIEEGADIIDIGGESTRPGAESVSLDKELNRVIPTLKAIRSAYPDIPISIDTYKSEVAKAALESGADIINDISGLQFDSRMVEVAKEFNTPVVIMHIKGTPKDMQKNPIYQDLMRELLEYFEERIETLSAHGIEKIIIDPGIGFGKNFEDNLKIIKHLNEFSLFNLPVLIGLSRKSFIGLITDEPVEDRLFGTLAADAIALSNGAHILRVHDVKPHKDLIKVFKAIAYSVPGTKSVISEEKNGKSKKS